MYMCRGIRVHAAGTKVVKLEESKGGAEQVGRGQLQREGVRASLEGSDLISLWSGEQERMVSEEAIRTACEGWS